MLEFREQGFYLFSLLLRVAELRRVGQLASTLSGQFIHGDSEIFISSTRALCLLRAGAATFGAANLRGVSFRIFPTPAGFSHRFQWTATKRINSIGSTY